MWEAALWPEWKGKMEEGPFAVSGPKTCFHMSMTRKTRQRIPAVSGTGSTCILLIKFMMMMMMMMMMTCIVVLTSRACNGRVATYAAYD